MKIGLGIHINSNSIISYMRNLSLYERNWYILYFEVRKHVKKKEKYASKFTKAKTMGACVQPF